MNLIKYVICCMLLIVGLSLSSNSARALVSGIDDEPASQVVSFYNSEDDSEFGLQLTNTNASSLVVLHVQVVESIKDPVTRVTTGCTEVKDFFVTLTGADTIVLDEFDLGIHDDTEGFIVANAVASVGSFVPVSFPHLIATNIIGNDETGGECGSDCRFASVYNSAGRDLDASGEFDLIQPVDVIAAYDTIVAGFGFFEDVNIPSVAWSDSYSAGGAYIADPGVATASGNDDVPVGLLVWDELETFISCGDVTLTCASCTGIDGSSTDTDEGDTCNDLENALCSDAPFTGFAQMINFDTADNLIVLAGVEETPFAGGLDYAVAIGEQVAPPVDCSTDPCDKLPSCTSECQAESCEGLDDCEDPICDGFPIAEGAVCDGGVAVETDCTDMIDNNENDLLDCADPDCFNATACQEMGGGGGGGNGCSVVAASSVGLANALLLLIPALGIAIRRRLIG